jgi:hypothetical protein
MTINKQNTHQGILFRNNNKTLSSQPDYTGSLNCNGVEFELAGWIKQGAKAKFLSLALKPKPEPVPERKAALASHDMDDEIAF